MPHATRRSVLSGAAVTGAAALSAAGYTAAPAHAGKPDTVRLTVLGTTDLHGNVFNWDYFKNAEYDRPRMSRIIPDQQLPKLRSVDQRSRSIFVAIDQPRRSCELARPGRPDRPRASRLLNRRPRVLVAYSVSDIACSRRSSVTAISSV